MTAPQAPKTYGDRHLSAQQISDLPPQQEQEYLERYMSPEDRYAYLQDNAVDQVAKKPWLAGFLENLAAQAKAGQQASQYGQQSVQQATNSQTEYVTGLSPSDVDYQGIDHPTLQGYVQSDLDAGQIGSMSNGYHQMSSTFDQISTTLTDAVNKSQSEWEGDAAESARGYFTSLQQWADGNSQNARLASEVTYDQSTAASTAKNNMPAPIPFSWADEMKNWASNPFTIVDNVKASVQKAQQSQQAHDQAAQVMSTYDHSLYSAASKQPVFAEPPKFEARGDGTTGQISGSIGSTQASGYAGPTGGSGGFTAVSPRDGRDAESVSGSLAGLGGSLTAGAKTGSVRTPSENTKAQAVQQPGGFNQSSQTSTNGANPMSALGGMPMGAPMGGGGFGDGEGYSSKVGRGGGFGPGSGSGSGMGSATGDGARTGLRAPGGAGAAEAAGAAGTRGTAGRSGASGTGGMGHGRGEGSEDEEHQRPSWLVEADPDEVFGTNERTAPPVIGE